jgi:uncharacterized protein (DUF885 family)
MIERTFKAMHALGNKFNVKDFHSAVLSHRNPPLLMLERKIDEMIFKCLTNN